MPCLTASKAGPARRPETPWHGLRPPSPRREGEQATNPLRPVRWRRRGWAGLLAGWLSRPWDRPPPAATVRRRRVPDDGCLRVSRAGCRGRDTATGGLARIAALPGVHPNVGPLAGSWWPGRPASRSTHPDAAAVH